MSSTTPTPDQQALVASLRGRLVVSCQAYPGEPLREAPTMARTAAAVVAAGAAAVRLQGLPDVLTGRSAVQVPIVGLWKHGHDGVVITPTLRHAVAVAEAGADVVAIDGTRRPRPDGLTLAETVRRLKERTGVLVMADCGSLEDALRAEDAGADLLGSTLAGYTGERPATDGPDLELVAAIVARCERPLVAEGRVDTPEQAGAAIEAGAHAVCVGSAITHPGRITERFLRGLPASGHGA
ncbi:MAG TPA: N-acetylmannosamine-6-phosphate 2-epimerase [Cellulomonas sp.]